MNEAEFHFSMRGKEKHIFSGDRPILALDDDRLGRADFSKRLAEAACNWKQDDSLVIALFGGWGSGKTSLKNLFKCHCKQIGNPFILEFNPWFWSAQGEIFKAFFDSIGERLGKPDVAKQSKSLAKKWRYYAACYDLGTKITVPLLEVVIRVLFFLGIFSASIPYIFNPLPKGFFILTGFLLVVFSSIAKLFPTVTDSLVNFFEKKGDFYEMDVADRRKTLATELNKLTSPLIIIIDDIDRLDKNEIKTVIQLVKTNCDLPNIVFLMLLNEEMVASALNEDWQNGREYLSKIIQVGFDIPDAQQSLLDTVLSEELHQAFGEIDPLLPVTDYRWKNAFETHIRHYLVTLRDVYRFTSMLTFHVSLHRNGSELEVNPIDLILLHTLRVFEHPVFETLKNGSISDSSALLDVLFFSSSNDQFNKKADDELDRLTLSVSPDKKESVKSLLKELFPQLNHNFQGDDSGWLYNLRLCHSEHFPKYFEFSIRNGSISLRELKDLIRNSNDPTMLSKAVSKYISLGKVNAFLTRFGNYTSSIPIENIGSVLHGFLLIDGAFPSTKNNVLSVPPLYQASGVMGNLLEMVSENDRCRVLMNCLQHSNAFVFPSILIEHCSHDSVPEDIFPVLNANDSTAMKAHMIGKIKNAAADGRLAKSDHLNHILHLWRLWDNGDDAKKWAMSFVKDFSSALTFLRSFLDCGFSSTGPNDSSTFDVLGLQELETFVDLKTMDFYLGKDDQISIRGQDQAAIMLFKRGLSHKLAGRPYKAVTAD